MVACRDFGIQIAAEYGFDITAVAEGTGYMAHYSSVMVNRLLIVCFLALASCSADSEIEFRICGKLTVPKQLDALRISILDDALQERNFALIELVPRQIRSDAAAKDSASAGSGATKSSAKDAGARTTKDGGVQPSGDSSSIQSLPVTASLPVKVDSGYVRVQALLQGEEVARFDRRIPNFSKTKEVDMPLTDACYGQTNCARGQTCDKGTCVVAPIGEQSPHCN